MNMPTHYHVSFHAHRISVTRIKETFAQFESQLRVNDIMASSRYLAENVVDALFDDDFGLSDEDNSEDDEDDRIYGYLGSSFFTPAEPAVDPEFEPDEELPSVDEVETTREGEAESSAENEEDTRDYVHEGEDTRDDVHEGEASRLGSRLPTADATVDESRDPDDVVTMDNTVSR